MAEETPPLLDRLRHEVDRIDGAIVELLVERLRVVGEIAAVKRNHGGLAMRPAREAILLRRLIARARGRLPEVTLVRMWRELLAATTRAQTPFEAVVAVPADRPLTWDLARDHLGSLTHLRRVADPAEALGRWRDGTAALAVLPAPDSSGAGWWCTLADRAWKRPPIVAKLPFVATAPAEDGAFVVADLPLEPSDDDLSLVVLETGPDLDRRGLWRRLEAASVEPRLIARAGSTATQRWLVEVAGFAGTLELAPAGEVLRVACLGGYARPVRASASS